MNIKKILAYYGMELNDDNKMLCPFHDEAKPSLDFNLKKNIFYCFGCGATGSIIDFVARYEGITTLQATTTIAKILKISSSSLPIEIKNKNKIDYKKQALEQFNSYIKPDWTYSKNYLGDRGFSPKILKDMDIRLNPISDYFFIIPLLENDKFVGFVRRTKDNRPNKYMYNYGFKRNEVLIGGYQKGKILFLVEGVLDYVRARQYGVKNVATLLGWKASEKQITKIKNITDKIVVALDNDKKGKEGTKWLEKYFKVLQFTYPKGVKDIGEIKKEDLIKGLKEALNGKEKNAQ
jgi:DNA primase